MSNVSFAYPNRIDQASLSGPGWSTARPLANLLIRQVGKKARSLGTTAKWYEAYPSAITIGTSALVGHNLSTTGQRRRRGFAADPRPTFELGLQQAATAGLSNTRTGNATYIGSNGLLQTAGAGVARITHDLSTRECLGLLVEGGGTNSIANSRQLSTWTNSNATSTTTATGVDGTANSASRVTATATNGRVTVAASTGTNPRVFSAYVRLVNVTGAIRQSLDNFASSTDISGSLTTAWKRFEITGSHATQTVGFELANSGDIIEVDYCQHEGGSVATSAILTTSGSASRVADVITYTVPAGVTMTGTLLLAGALLRKPSSTQPLVELYNGTQTASVRATSTPTLVAEYANAGTQCSIASATVTEGAAFAVAFSFAANDFRAYTNGSAGTPDTSGTVSANAATTLRFDAGTGGHTYTVKSVRYYSANRTNAELQALSGATDCEFTPDYDSGWVDAWPAAWVSATTAEQQARAVGTAQLTPGTPQTYPYWREDIKDPANASGYVAVGRPFHGGTWVPVVNISYGASFGFLPRDLEGGSDSGAKSFRRRRKPRSTDFSLDWLSEAEALDYVLDMQEALGNSGELLFSFDPADTARQPRLTFLGYLPTLDPPRPVLPDTWSVRMRVEELL